MSDSALPPPDIEPYADLNLVELLDALEPVPEPPAISMMPQTVGWIWLGLIGVVLIAMGVRVAVGHHRANAYRRAGLQALQAAGDDPAQIAAVLRRTALAAGPRDRIVGLTGDDWLRFLDRTLQTTGFTEGPGQILARAPYRPVPPDPELTRLARRWIRQHDLSRGLSP